MAAAKPVPVPVLVVAFLLVAAAAVPLPGSGGGELPPFPLPPRPTEPPAVPLPGPGGAKDKDLPFTLLSADPAAAQCRGPAGTCPARDEVPHHGAGAGVSTMASDPEGVRRRVYHQQRNSVPCSRRGASYYNCRPGAHASPYRRACSRIKNCHG